MFLQDVANFSIRDRYNKYADENFTKQLEDAQKESRNPGVTLRRGLLTGALLGGIAPLTVGGNYKTALAGAIGTGTVGTGLSMLLRSRQDLKGEYGRDKKEKRLLKNVGRGTLTGAALGGLSALALRGRGYGAKGLLGRTVARSLVGATAGSAGAYAGTKIYNKFKNDEKR